MTKQIINPDPTGPGPTGRLLDLIVEHAAAAKLPALDWLTQNARDAVRIAVILGGFDGKDLVTRLAKVRSRGERLNVATVYRMLAQITDEYDQALAATSMDVVTAMAITDAQIDEVERSGAVSATMAQWAKHPEFRGKSTRSRKACAAAWNSRAEQEGR